MCLFNQTWRLRRRVIHQLNIDLLMEENSVAHYAAQAQLMCAESIKEKFEQFSREEDIHVILLEVMIHRLGGRVYPLRRLFRACGWLSGWLTGCLGERFVLWVNAWLERGGAQLYAAHRKAALPLNDLVLIRQLDRLQREEAAHEAWLWRAQQRTRLRVVANSREL